MIRCWSRIAAVGLADGVEQRFVGWRSRSGHRASFEDLGLARRHSIVANHLDRARVFARRRHHDRVDERQGASDRHRDRDRLESFCFRARCCVPRRETRNREDRNPCMSSASRSGRASAKKHLSRFCDRFVTDVRGRRPTNLRTRFVVSEVAVSIALEQTGRPLVRSAGVPISAAVG